MTISNIKVSSHLLQRFLLCTVLFLFIAVQSGMVRAVETAASPIITITFHDDLVSAKLVDAPLIDVLQRIQQEYGFRAHFHGDLTEPITMSFTDMPLQKCLRQLTINQSLSLATRPIQNTSDQNEAKQITEIWVLSRNKIAKTGNIAFAAPTIPASGSSSNLVDGGGNPPGQVSAAQPMNQDGAESSKQQTIKNLAAIGDPASVMALAEFSHDVDVTIRQMAVSTIGSIDSEESTRALGQVLRDEPDMEIRKTALRALGQRIHEATAKTLLEGELNDADAEMKALAQQLLAQ